MRIQLDSDDLRPLIRAIVAEVLSEVGGDDRLAYSEPEAAALVGLQPHQLRDRRLEGKVAATKIGKSWFYRRSDLMALFDTGAGQ